MKYILLAAGKGQRLHPLTLAMPKSMYKLDKKTTVLQRMVRLIEKYDSEAQIVIVTGFMREKIRNEIKGNVIFVDNPFYETTNSIASLWFAKEHLLEENITIINADIVMEEALVEKGVCKPVDKPLVMIDSSIKIDGDYNVQVNNGRVLVMSKNLDTCYGEYAGVTKLDKDSAKKLYDEICLMVNNGYYDQWYENALVQMIFNEDFQLFYEDISRYEWTEVDCVEDMLRAKKIHDV